MVATRTVVIVGDVGKSQNVKLLCTAAASRIDGEEDWPRYGAADQADDDGDLEEAQEEIAVESVMVEDPCVRDLVLQTISGRGGLYVDQSGVRILLSNRRTYSIWPACAR